MQAPADDLDGVDVVKREVVVRQHGDERLAGGSLRASIRPSSEHDLLWCEYKYRPAEEEEEEEVQRGRVHVLNDPLKEEEEEEEKEEEAQRRSSACYQLPPP